MSSEESRIMARLRASAARTTPDSIAASLAALPRAPAARMASTDPVVAFLGNVLRNGGTADAVTDRQAAVQAVSRFVSERHGQRRLVAGHDPRLAAMPWRDGGLLPRFGAATGDDRVAISYARRAIAETGSTVLWVDRDNPASNNLLPDDHIVLVDSADVHLRLEAAWDDPALSDAQQRPRGLIMISGPSSTADIALQLVTGAHGPRAWHVIVLGVERADEAMEEAREIS